MNKRTHSLLFALVVLTLLLSGMPVVAAPTQQDGIIIDGWREAAWGDPVASDPVGDMTEPNLDLEGLYVVEDADNYFIGFDARASAGWRITYGIYIDADQVDGSGGTSDPWDRAVDAVSAHLPEYTLYVLHVENDQLEAAQLSHWNGSAWISDTLTSLGGEQAFGVEVNWIEYRVPKAALGNPTRIALELFTTGDSGHAQDTVPSDPNVAFSVPDPGPEVTTLSAFVLFPQPSPSSDWYVQGDFNGWSLADPMFDDGTHGDAVAGDGVYTALVAIALSDRYEFKVATEDGSASYPESGNSWLDTTTDDESVTITFDTNVYGDGWLPETNVIGVSTEPGSWTAVGDWQGWDNADPTTAMTPLVDGEYELSVAIASPGPYQYKAVKTGTWDSIGADGRSINASTADFETAEAGQTVTFTVDGFDGRIRVEVEPAAPTPEPDENIWWDGLAHDSRDDLYRVPWGAVTTGKPVLLRFRTYHNDVTDVILRVWSTAVEAQTLYPMELVATTDDPPYGYDYWQATIPAQNEPTILWYRFIVRDGSDEDFYEDDDLLDGGWGTAYDDSPDYSFQIDVYDPDFETPEWMKNAVVYQIFPDRFYNGNPRNDPKPCGSELSKPNSESLDLTKGIAIYPDGADRLLGWKPKRGAEPCEPPVYDNPVLVKSWQDLPEGYCRAYESFDCDQEPLGRDFFGGDLKGVEKKLGYLKRLGVTAIYFNPIFKAPSNHLYDTSNYHRVDPALGTMVDYGRLIYQARKKGIRVILDGVFNHTSSDSLYFDKYSRYITLGAYENQNSRFYDWYTFYEWPDDYDSWWGFDSLPVLTEVQKVKDFIYGYNRSVARWWIKLGAAGWRLDVAPDKSHEWWQEFRPRVKSVNSDAVILGEIWDDASPWLLGNEFDSTMNYRFRRALIGFVNGDTHDANQGFIQGLNPDQFNSVLQSVKEDYPLPAFEAAMNLVGTHDTARILWVLTPGARNREDKEFNADNLAEGKAKLKLLAILQMTLPGAPTIYYGDEVGLTGDTDPDDRRPFPWGDKDVDLLAHYKRLALLRHELAFLRTGSFDPLYAHNEDGTYAYGRKDPSGAAVVAVNRDTVAHDLVINLSGYIPDGTTLVDKLTGTTHSVADGQVTVNVGERWGAILVTLPGTDLTPPPAPTGLVAAASDSRADLTWSGVPDAAGYYVYRSPVSGGGYTRLNDVPLAEAAYTDDTVLNGRLTYYVVTAVDAVGNESGRSNEEQALPHLVIDWSNLQGPPSIEHTISGLDPTDNITGQVWIDGHTAVPGPTEGLIAQVGYGPDGSDPEDNPDWIWVEAEFNVDAGSNDEFISQLLPEAVGTCDYAYRYSTTGGQLWVYADLDGTGNGYDPAQAGSLTVNPSSDITPPEAPANLHVTEASPSFISLAWDAASDGDIYRYELYRGDTRGGPYVKIANIMAPVTDCTDWDIASGASTYYVVRAADTSFNLSVESDEVEAIAQARPVQVTFNTTLPDTTPDGDDIYIGGNLNGWDPAGTLMERPDPNGLFATVTLTLYEGDQLEYKYTRGSWTYVEKGEACEEISNRAATIVYGTDGTMSLDNVVLNWRNTDPCGD